MRPIAKALDILQAETNSHMGWLLPTIYLLEDKLLRLESSIKVCYPLLHSLQSAIQKRFGEMKRDPELIAVAILLSKFKIKWTDKDHIKTIGEFSYNV